MIARKDLRIGDRIVGNDPEAPTDHPYKGTVTDICETGTGAYDYYATIDLDEESIQDPYIRRICPDGVMTCFPWAIDLLTENTSPSKP